MATLADVILAGTAYQDLYAATSITVGTPLNIQNKSSHPVYLQNKATIPDNTSTNGWVLDSGESVRMDGTIVGAWAFGNGPLLVEETT